MKARVEYIDSRQARSGVGEMAKLIRAFDWSRTPIGPREQWPASLRTVVDVMLATQFPMALLWGREVILIYNDAYRIICGDKHPAALGRSTQEIWSEVWHINQPIFAAVMDRGKTLAFENKLFPINRRGHLADAYFTLCYSPVRKEDGSIGGVLVVLEETTGRIESLKALRASERKYRDLFENLNSAVVLAEPILDASGRLVDLKYLMANPAVRKHLTKTPEELVGRLYSDVFHSHGRNPVFDIYEKVLSTGESYKGEVFLPAISRHCDLAVYRPAPSRLALVVTDVTERKLAEAALKQACDTLAEAQKIAHLGSFEYAAATRTTVWSDEEFRIYGLDPSGPSPTYDTMLMKCIHPDDADLLHETFTKAMQSYSVYELEHRIVRPDGSVRWVHDRAQPYFDAEGKLARYIGTTLDITERKRTAEELDLHRENLEKLVQERTRDLEEEITERRRVEETLLESESRFRQLVNSVPQLVWTCQPDGACDFLSPQWVEYTGLPAEVQLGSAWLEQLHPEDREKTFAAWNRTITLGDDFHVEFRIRRKDGVYRWFDTQAVRLYDGAGRVIKWVGTNTDITERKRSEAALRESEERFQLFMDNSPTIVWIKNEKGRYVYLSKTYEDRFGVRLEEWRGKTDAELWPEEIAEKFRRNDRAVLDAGHAIEVEEETINPDGSSCYWLNCKFPFSDATGKRYVAGIGIDITERKRAQSLLQQVQELETVGRLAGGMAHEFNNLLQGIMGYTELCRSMIAPDHPLGAHLNEIDVISIRAVNLIRKLLGFARKQIITPKRFDLNKHVAGFVPLLRTLIREDIELVWIPGAGHVTVNMDPSQIDQILVNLAANACDAIRGTGKITITTTNTILDALHCATCAETVQGNYVMLTFSDTGCGMDEAIRSHLFEPFFTTKEVGKGTGMGLATVHGIVNQNNGNVTVASEPGKGTIFRIYLPLFTDQPIATAVGEAATAANAASPSPTHQGKATILLVDDDPIVLKIVDAILHGFGYTVLAAASPEQALRLDAEHSGSIDLLLTDVVMPGQNGRELADRLMARHPRLKCIFMSGYTADIIAQHGILEDEVDFLSKPFSREQLANKLREVLNRGSGVTSPVFRG